MDNPFAAAPAPVAAPPVAPPPAPVAPANPFAPPPVAAAAAVSTDTPPVGPALQRGQLVARITEDPWKGKVTEAGIVLHPWTDEHGRNQAVVGWLQVSDPVDTTELQAV